MDSQIITYDIDSKTFYKPKPNSLHSNIYKGNYSIFPCSPTKKNNEAALKTEPPPKNSLSINKSKFERCLTTKERRIKVSSDDLKELPYSCVVALNIIFNIGEFLGSGVLVSPRHVLTARHNILDKSYGWAQQVRVKPAVHGTMCFFRVANVTRIYTFTPFDFDDAGEDMALLVLDDDLGARTGWMGMLSIKQDDELFQQFPNLTGYPADKCNDDSYHMWTHSGPLLKINTESITYHIDTMPGNSGSPLWINLIGVGPFVIGIHSQGTDKYNSGCRLSIEKLEVITKLIDDTWHIEAMDQFTKPNTQSSNNSQDNLIDIDETDTTAPYSEINSVHSPVETSTSLNNIINYDQSVDILSNEQEVQLVINQIDSKQKLSSINNISSPNYIMNRVLAK